MVLLKIILVCSHRVWSSVSESIYRDCSNCSLFCALKVYQKTLLKCITCYSYDSAAVYKDNIIWVSVLNKTIKQNNLNVLLSH